MTLIGMVEELFRDIVDFRAALVTWPHVHIPIDPPSLHALTMCSLPLYSFVSPLLLLHIHPTVHPFIPSFLSVPSFFGSEIHHPLFLFTPLLWKLNKVLHQGHHLWFLYASMTPPSGHTWPCSSCCNCRCLSPKHDVNQGSFLNCHISTRLKGKLVCLNTQVPDSLFFFLMFMFLTSCQAGKLHSIKNIIGVLLF